MKYYLRYIWAYWVSLPLRFALFKMSCLIKLNSVLNYLILKLEGRK